MRNSSCLEAFYYPLFSSPTDRVSWQNCEDKNEEPTLSSICSFSWGQYPSQHCGEREGIVLGPCGPFIFFSGPGPGFGKHSASYFKEGNVSECKSSGGYAFAGMCPGVCSLPCEVSTCHSYNAHNGGSTLWAETPSSKEVKFCPRPHG